MNLVIAIASGRKQSKRSANTVPRVTNISVDASDLSLLVATYTFADTEADLEDDVLPIASGVSFSGLALADGQLLTSSYLYTHFNGKAEAGSTYKWYRANDGAGAGAAVIATTRNYTAVTADVGKYLKFEVTPVNTAGTIGTPVASAYSGPVSAALTLREVYVSLGSATSPLPSGPAGIVWNNLATSNPDGSYLSGFLVDKNNVATGMKIAGDLAMAVQNLGKTTGNNSGYFVGQCARRILVQPHRIYRRCF
ncbi:MAG: hypothetical protein WDO15_11340 [Bacteroidota bacterium]